MGHEIMFFEVMIGSLCQNSEAGRYFATPLDYLDDLDLYDELLTWYHEIKAKDPYFEVVFVRLDNRNTTSVEDDLVLSAAMYVGESASLVLAES